MSLVLFISFFLGTSFEGWLQEWSKVASICVLTRACFFWRNWRCFRVRRTCFEGQVKLSWDVALYYCAQQAILLRYNWYNAWWLQLRWILEVGGQFATPVWWIFQTYAKSILPWAFKPVANNSSRNQILLGCSQPLVQCPGSHVRLARLPGSFRLWPYQCGRIQLSGYHGVIHLGPIPAQHSGLGNCRYPSHWSLRLPFTLHPNCMLNLGRPSLNRLYSDRLHSLKRTVRPWK